MQEFAVYFTDGTVGHVKAKTADEAKNIAVVRSYCNYKDGVHAIVIKILK